MPDKFTVGTFNVENLFTRYRFRGKRVTRTVRGRKVYKYRPFTPEELKKAVRGGFVLDMKKFNRLLESSRVLTAKALRGMKADVMGLQEVENLDTLRLFNSRFLKRGKYAYPLLIDGNDPRLIDVGILSKLPVEHLTTHQFLRSGRSRVFSRDCLEAHIRVGDKIVPLFINHLKSMVGGRAKTKKRRETQAGAHLEILVDRFGKKFGDSDFVVLGDLNDYMEPGKEDESGIRALLQSDQMENVVLRLDPQDRWTHFYKRDKSYNQLDYILISKSLARKNPDVLPVIERRGQPLRVNLPGKPKRVKNFFPEVKGKLKASDHCPLAVTLKV